MGSYDYGKREIVRWIWGNFPEGSTALDVGACDGNWKRWIGDFLKMDAVEVFELNITGNKLDEKYDKVICADIKDVEYEWYDLIIFGDVIEHMTVENAQKVLAYAWPRCRDMIVAVPWLYKQDAIYGNKWEIHIQDDLTPELFAERYPGFDILVNTNMNYCYFHKGSEGLLINAGLG